MLTIHIKHMDALTTKEVVEAIKTVAPNISSSEIRVTMRDTFGGTQAAIVGCEIDLGPEVLKKDRIKIGSIHCEVRQHVEVKSCNTCWSPGHFSKDCVGQNRRNACLKCGQDGHKAKDCLNEKYCPDPNISRGCIETPEKKPKSRWRHQNIETRKREKAKKRRNLGHSYDDWKGKKIPPKTMGPPCHCKKNAEHYF
ncbi:unnamed protein product [Psylliodes chrysocephalus]|uniref:CCHC-type domain-containing protein n=1 Tax=Psylliodes chrysocephalus TaxID=3402493 RepID=A0A9P0G9M6_9CUCU|nr:unnamed protein product [Psylliodes chrysocephala]